MDTEKLNHLIVTVRNGIVITDSERRALRKAFFASLRYMGIKSGVSAELLVVSADEIKAINSSERDICSVTDVLSFPALELVPGEKPADVAQEYDCSDGLIDIGSIVICADRAVSQANEYGHSTEREFAFLTAHSVLHLLGFDHERSKDEENRMFDLQKAILKYAGYGKEN